MMEHGCRAWEDEKIPDLDRAITFAIGFGDLPIAITLARWPTMGILHCLQNNWSTIHKFSILFITKKILFSKF